ncbi:FadR family transcriptional regulator [Pelagibius litoralis]|uniref:FadR family transcriptional regulator n=1 Tax=Pelagibius litoralis TaxID=374515 RepID=A0A967F3M5_9PROT|nr:FCD domain-containing protein [Pelagibius litoralis]NIA72500.1 FadR family transcriptional regulator [Pelagibius litoralis]
MKQPVTIPFEGNSARSDRKGARVGAIKGRNRPRAVAETIKEWIIANGLMPGDRLPQEHQLIERLEVSKGTIREALKVMEAQGLIRTRTGPGGGAFITEVSADHATALLANHFFFKEVSIGHIYELRIALEPQLVQELAPRITDAQIAELRGVMSAYTEPPTSIEEERRQRVAELEFHEVLSRYSKNAVLGFFCGFLARLLKDLAVCKRIYNQPNPELRERGVSYQAQLIEAFEARDAEAAGAVMDVHMRAAKRMMLEREAEIEKGFLDTDT